MPCHGSLAEYGRRKEELLRRSALNRQLLLAESPRLRRAAGWLELGLEAGRKVRMIGELAAPWLSFWRTRRRTRPGLASKLAGGASIARSFARLWKEWSRTRRGGVKPSPSRNTE